MYTPSSRCYRRLGSMYLEVISMFGLVQGTCLASPGHAASHTGARSSKNMHRKESREQRVYTLSWPCKERFMVCTFRSSACCPVQGTSLAQPRSCSFPIQMQWYRRGCTGRRAGSRNCTQRAGHAKRRLRSMYLEVISMLGLIQGTCLAQPGPGGLPHR